MTQGEQIAYNNGFIIGKCSKGFLKGGTYVPPEPSPTGDDNIIVSPSYTLYTGDVNDIPSVKRVLFTATGATNADMLLDALVKAKAIVTSEFGYTLLSDNSGTQDTTTANFVVSKQVTSRNKQIYITFSISSTNLMYYMSNLQNTRIGGGAFYGEVLLGNLTSGGGYLCEIDTEDAYILNATNDTSIAQNIAYGTTDNVGLYTMSNGSNLFVKGNYMTYDYDTGMSKGLINRGFYGIYTQDNYTVMMRQRYPRDYSTCYADRHFKSAFTYMETSNNKMLKGRIYDINGKKYIVSSENGRYLTLI